VSLRRIDLISFQSNTGGRDGSLAPHFFDLWIH
jgi:hypothetical protein